jgi:hypothetical protein
MNKTWTVIEKILGVLIGVWGIITLYSVTLTVANMFSRGYAAANHITYFQIFLAHHLNFLLALAGLFGGFMLVYNEKKGWMLSVISSALYIVNFFRSSQSNATSSSEPYYQYFKSYSAMALLFIAILVLLLQKPFLKKYHPNGKNWLWMIIIVAVLVIDKFIF